ncbi:lysosome-associated membrane glycoprotein 2 isoform X3 [Sebastes umbrosus]|uniref:lysosome-associated membrane glycoprotein 2 isoform X3 n=1 Tax=Sebastes umbrosus TaxID=72105 RepID=UPI00189D6C66|nr:lysosome-associated membrane glycoprotein 2 isoform X3 [Sebastes umbrosus]
MYRYAAFVLLLAFLGTAFQLSHGTEVNVKDKDNKLCLYANLMVNFSVSYEVADNKSATVEFELPGEVTTSGSTCDAKSSTLKLNFGEGHSWSVNFTISGEKYQADTITFSYNLSDATVFPNSALNDTATVAVKPQLPDIGLDTCYSCKSKETIEADSVNQTLWNVLIQAFVSNNSTSENITSCDADVPTTPVPPTTTTPAAPVTNSTIPVTTSTTPPPTTPPTPTLPAPTIGTYSIKPDENSTACLMANFGLRVGVMKEEMNFEPNGTIVSGSCGVNSSLLMLVSNAMSITLTFANDTTKFRLHALNITGKTSSGVAFSEVNTNLSLWEAAVGSSYMCNKEQNYTITSQLTIYTFDLQVQPFGVKKGVFSTAHECSLDDTSILIPIIVGAALAGLIVIVVIAYVIGRRKTYVGYQTL